LATWKVKTEEFNFCKLSNHAEIKEKVLQWRKERSIPQLALLTEGDNELLIDFENVLSVKMLYSTIKKRPEFSLTEFLFNIENGVVANAQGNPFTNEFIITFKKKTTHNI